MPESVSGVAVGGFLVAVDVAVGVGHFPPGQGVAVGVTVAVPVGLGVPYQASVGVGNGVAVLLGATVGASATGMPAGAQAETARVITDISAQSGCLAFIRNVR